MRPTWDEWGLALAGAVASRADCRRRQVGAVVLDPAHRVVATGYNGAPPGRLGCLDGGCPRGLADTVAPESSYDSGAGLCISNHAEINALLYADRSKVEGGTLYVTHKPCIGCVRIIANSGVGRVVWPHQGWEVASGSPAALLQAALDT
jgi:dCMP deaminase